MADRDPFLAGNTYTTGSPGRPLTMDDLRAAVRKMQGIVDPQRMTEHEWLTSEDSNAMTRFFLENTHLWPRFANRISAWQFAYRDSTLQCPLILRDVLGNPFRPVSLCGVREGIEGIERTELVMECENCAAIIHWRDRTIPKLAQRIHEDNTFTPHEMGMLADALEEAGCTEAAILDHLRGTERCAWCDGLGYSIVEITVEEFMELRRQAGEMGEFVRPPHAQKPVKQVRCSKCWRGIRPAKHVRGCWVLELLTPHAEFVPDLSLRAWMKKQEFIMPSDPRILHDGV